MTHLLGDLSLALYLVSFFCYARNLYVPNVWVGRLALFLLAPASAFNIGLCTSDR